MLQHYGKQNWSSCIIALSMLIVPEAESYQQHIKYLSSIEGKLKCSAYKNTYMQILFQPLGLCAPGIASTKEPQ